MERGGLPTKGSMAGAPATPGSTNSTFSRSFRFLGSRGVRSGLDAERVATTFSKRTCQTATGGVAASMGAVVAEVKWVVLGSRRGTKRRAVFGFEGSILRRAKGRTC